MAGHTPWTVLGGCYTMAHTPCSLPCLLIHIHTHTYTTPNTLHCYIPGYSCSHGLYHAPLHACLYPIRCPALPPHPHTPHGYTSYPYPLRVCKLPCPKTSPLAKGPRPRLLLGSGHFIRRSIARESSPKRRPTAELLDARLWGYAKPLRF